METLHNHLEMIDLNPLVEERHPIKPPPEASPEEYQCQWYMLTDRVSYLPGGLASSMVSYNVCFHDLDRGLQTHCYAPLGLNIKGKWTLGGSLPGEPVPPPELGIGAPLTGLYIREDVDMRCNIMMTSFVKKTLKSSHARLVDRLVIKAQFDEVEIRSERISHSPLPETLAEFARSQTSSDHSPSDYGGAAAGLEDGSAHSVSSRFSNKSGPPQLPNISSPEIRWPASPDFRGRSNSPQQQQHQQQQQQQQQQPQQQQQQPQQQQQHFRGRSNSPQQQPQAQQQQQTQQQQQQQPQKQPSMHPASLTVGTPPPRSLSEERRQVEYSGLAVSDRQNNYCASIGGYPGSHQKPTRPYAESAIKPPQGARPSWQSSTPPLNGRASWQGTPPLNSERTSWQNEAPLPLVTKRNISAASKEDLDMAFQEAAPTYHAYSETRRSAEPLSNKYAYGGDQTIGRAYSEVPRVYGAAELS